MKRTIQKPIDYPGIIDVLEQTMRIERTLPDKESYLADAQEEMRATPGGYKLGIAQRRVRDATADVEACKAEIQALYSRLPAAEETHLAWCCRAVAESAIVTKDLEAQIEEIESEIALIESAQGKGSWKRMAERNNNPALNAAKARLLPLQEKLSAEKLKIAPLRNLLEEEMTIQKEKYEFDRWMAGDHSGPKPAILIRIEAEREREYRELIARCDVLTIPRGIRVSR
jgi:hypothetical protein